MFTSHIARETLLVVCVIVLLHTTLARPGPQRQGAGEGVTGRPDVSRKPEHEGRPDLEGAAGAARPHPSDNPEAPRRPAGASGSVASGELRVRDHSGEPRQMDHTEGPESEEFTAAHEFGKGYRKGPGQARHNPSDHSEPTRRPAAALGELKMRDHSGEPRQRDHTEGPESEEFTAAHGFEEGHRKGPGLARQNPSDHTAEPHQRDHSEGAESEKFTAAPGFGSDHGKGPGPARAPRPNPRG